MAAKTFISSSPFLAPPLPSLSRTFHDRPLLLRPRKFNSRVVKFSLHDIPPPESLASAVDFHSVVSRVESLLYTLADAAVAADPSASDAGAAAAQKNGGWFGFISEAMEVVLKTEVGVFSELVRFFARQLAEQRGRRTPDGELPGTVHPMNACRFHLENVLKDGLTALHIPYSYGFAIILLTVIVKVATFPLTKQQVESTLAMQNLQPKIKAIQERYAGNQVLGELIVRMGAFQAKLEDERIQLETSRLYKQAGVNPLAGCFPTLATIPVWIGLYQALSNVANEGLLTEGFFWIPSLGGPTTIAARQSGAGISWLFPFLDGHPPLGWSDTLAYLVLPVLLVVSQYVSMEIMKPPQTDDSSKNTLLVFKFLPLMIGYFSLSVPSGLSIYW
ncbi:Inner membrane protein PPF-1, chloroplastic [Asimina triloba]